MSEASSAAAADSTSASTTPDSTSPGPAKQTSRAARSSTVTGPESPSSRTSGSSTSLLSRSAPMFSLAGSPARTFPVPASVLAWLTGTAPVCGSSTPESFAFFDRESLSWRTSQGSLLPDSESSWPTWPKRGMTQGGQAYEAATSVPLTAGSGSSSLLPTPNASVSQDGEKPETFFARAALLKKKHGNGNGVGTPLTIAVQLLPTPQAADGSGGRMEKSAAENDWKRPSGAKAAKPLGTIVALLPTPTGDDANNVTRKSGTFSSLAREAHAMRLLPTPRASDGPEKTSHGRTWSATDFNLHTWARQEFSGEPTSPPSDDGNTSPTPHPHQLTIGDD